MISFQQIKPGTSLLYHNCRKIKPYELGYIHPDKKISFATQEVAEKYAQNRIISALNADKPFERAVVYKDNLIICDVDGGTKRVNIPREVANLKDCMLAHGHPDSVSDGAFTLSLADFICMKALNLKKMTAYNKNGEYASFIANRHNNPILQLLPQKLQKKYYALKNISLCKTATSELAKKYASIYPKNLQNKLEASIHVESKPYGNHSKIKAFQKNPLTPEEKKQAKFTMNFQRENFNKILHEFWANMATKFGYKYETNFSNLMKIKSSSPPFPAR